MWENGWGCTHIFMLPAIYISIVFLIFSIVHLREKVKKSLNCAQNSLSLTQTETEIFVKYQLKLVFSSKANLFAFVAVALLFFTELAPLDGSELLYVN
jgi:hypothetical protein